MIVSTYPEAISYLYKNLPMFQRVGAAAIKPGLTNTIALCQFLGNPQSSYPTVHIGGTNGKGSSSHMIASILQSAGYKTGLYTSPHLKEFTERIRVNGEEVPQAWVVGFVNRIHDSISLIQPSFFEITVAMAFEFFREQKVDVAVIEVGLGGRLDSTNVIMPVVSLITNIGWDHKDILGDTLEKIASEKAGIIKKGVPAIVSQRQSDVEEIFVNTARRVGAPLAFASDQYRAAMRDGVIDIFQHDQVLFNDVVFPLAGSYQAKNLPGVMATIDVLKNASFDISDRAIVDGLGHVISHTKLKGRWQKLSDRPLTICDTGHNEDGIREVVAQLKRQSYRTLRMVLGMVKDKDISAVIKLLPKDATFYFCKANIPRAMNAGSLAEMALVEGIRGEVFENVNDAIAQAGADAHPDDLIFIGGSTFVVAEIDSL